MLPMQGIWVQSLVRELDPTCLSWIGMLQLKIPMLQLRPGAVKLKKISLENFIFPNTEIVPFICYKKLNNWNSENNIVLSLKYSWVLTTQKTWGSMPPLATKTTYHANCLQLCRIYFNDCFFFFTIWLTDIMKVIGSLYQTQVLPCI